MTGTENTVLLAMDFQNGIAGDDAFASTGVLERARDAVAAARSHDIPVVWVRVALREGHPELSATASFAQIAAHGDLDETHASTSIHDTLDRHQGEPIVTKRRISAFTGSCAATGHRLSCSPESPRAVSCSRRCARPPISTSSSLCSPTPAPTATPRSTRCSPRRCSPSRRQWSPSPTGRPASPELGI